MNHCRFCDYPEVRLIEEPHFLSKEELGDLFENFECVKFAAAECPACGAEMLALCGGVRRRYLDVTGHRGGEKFDKVNRNQDLYETLWGRFFTNSEDERNKPKRKVRKAWVGEDNLIIMELPNHKEEEK